MVEVGKAAPEFELRDQHAQTHTLSSYRGRNNVLLVFYPFAFTGVCTGEMGAIRDDLAALQHNDAVVLAVSCDPVASLRAFADQERLEHALLSDFWPHGAVASAYGVFNNRLGAAERGSFLIGKDGIVRWSVRADLGEARDVASYQKALAEL